MLTGEIPEEQQTYESNKQIFDDQIHLLGQKEIELKDQMDQTNNLLKQIKSDSNQALDDL